METKKITYEEALARFKRSLEINETQRSALKNAADIIVENRNPLLEAITDEFETASQALTSDKP